jgi:hypothetical protein
VGACGSSLPLAAARRFSSPYQLQTIVDYLTVRLLSGIRPPRGTAEVFLRGFGATHGSPERRSNGSELSFAFADLQSTIRSTICADSHDLHGLRRSHSVCMSLKNLTRHAVAAEGKISLGHIVGYASRWFPTNAQHWNSLLLAGRCLVEVDRRGSVNGNRE